MSPARRGSGVVEELAQEGTRLGAAGGGDEQPPPGVRVAHARVDKRAGRLGPLSPAWVVRALLSRAVALSLIPRLASVLLLGLVVAYYMDRQLIQRQPSRIVSDVPDFAYTIGRFTVQWDRSAAALFVVHKRYWCIQDCTRTVWSTVPGVAFVTVADGSKLRFRETIAGHYHVHHRVKLRTTVQWSVEEERTCGSGDECAHRATLDMVHYDPARRALTLSGVLVKEHALPRAAWLQLRKMRASWQELTALFSEHKANILLRTTYNLTFSEVPSATSGRLQFDLQWDKEIYDGLSTPLSPAGLVRWRTPQGATQVLNVSDLSDDEEEEEGEVDDDDEALAEDGGADQEIEDLDTAEGAVDNEAAPEPGEEGEADVREVVASGRRQRPRRQFDMVKLLYAAEEGERFYGLGAQFSSLDHSGKRVPILTQEQGIGRGRQPMTWALNRFMRGIGGRWHSTYTAVPHYLSSLARSLFVSTNTYLEFDFTKPGRVAIDAVAPSGQLSGQIVAGRTPLEVLEAYTEWAGRMRPLPAWSQTGVILGMTGGQDKVRARVAAAKASGVPVAAVWLQDWTGIVNTSFAERIWWNWRLSRDLYPDWEALAAELRAEGVHVLTYVNPFLMKDAKSARGDMYREAAARGFLIKDPKSKKGAPYHMAHEITFGLLDLSNPEGVQWIEGIIRDMALSAGRAADGTPLVSGWMADFGEYLPFNARLASGEDPVVAHNRYPQEWAALNRRVLAAVGLEGKGFFFSRSAAGQSPAASPLMWMGDQLVSWDAHDGIKSALLGQLQAGLSGLAFTHSDIGGYTAVPTRSRTHELLLRWMELSAFADAVFRTHQGNKPFHNAQVWDTPEAWAHLARFARVHVALRPYRTKLMAEAAATGAPVTRPLLLHYPHDTTAAALSHQFLVGRDLLVAPVLDRNVSKVHAYLPPGDRWRDAWTGVLAALQPGAAHGVWVTADAPLGWPAVFLREGATREAQEAQRNLAAVGPIPPPPRLLVSMDATHKLILGYFDQ